MELCLYFNSEKESDTSLFSEELTKLLSSYREDSKITFLCIGSDRATGDSLGPLIGYNLKKLGYTRVYGTLDNPVHAKNLNSTIDLIKKEVDNPLIIAIDASLGKSPSIGSYMLYSGPIKPGAGVGKNLPYVGDISITGIVNQSGLSDDLLLLTTRLGHVMKIVERICDGINDSLIKLAG